MDIVPTLDHETAFWDAGLSRIAGVDEVGRGAMAGPILAAAVIFPAAIVRKSFLDVAGLSTVRDSKLLSPSQREALFPAILASALAVGVGSVDVAELDWLGVGPANRLAMERAIWALSIEPDAILLDATVVDLSVPQVGLIDGDARSFSIAAASIIAKVTRDRIMVDCHGADPRFRFDLHKGYVTPHHLQALQEYGPCVYHRRCFAPVARSGKSDDM